MLELGVIADDLTGGAKVASLLESEGVACPLATSVEALERLPDDAQAVVVGRKMLLLPPEQAAADATRVAEGLLAKGARRLYYKYSAVFSSTAKGNIGPVSEALLALTGADHLLFCPAFPERGVTVYQGRLFLGRNMLHESPQSRDPVTPMTNSNLVEVLQAQSRMRVGLLPYRHVRASKAERKAHLQRQIDEGVAFFITDVLEKQDLVRIAELAVDMPATTGADELPVYLARAWQGAKRDVEPRRLLPAASGFAAVIAGSCTPKTNRQVARFARTNPVFRIDLVDAAGNDNLAEQIIEWAAPRLPNSPIGIATTADHAEVQRVQQALGRAPAAALADRLLGDVAAGLHRLGARKFVVAGGETSGAVMTRLGIDLGQVAAYDELLGGYCHTGETADPLALVLKAGGAGEEDFIESALDRMREADAA